MRRRRNAVEEQRQIQVKKRRRLKLRSMNRSIIKRTLKHLDPNHTQSEDSWSDWTVSLARALGMGIGRSTPDQLYKQSGGVLVTPPFNRPVIVPLGSEIVRITVMKDNGSFILDTETFRTPKELREVGKMSMTEVQAIRVEYMAEELNY